MVSEIGLGAEWLERHGAEECAKNIRQAEASGINILDCWMSEPNVRTNIGNSIKNTRDKWIVQGHIGSIWKDGQYSKCHDLKEAIPAFEDLLERFQTDVIDLGMIHFVDGQKELDEILGGDFLKYVQELKASGKIRYIGMSSHSPAVALRAVQSGVLDTLMFSINPAFDFLPPTENIDDYFVKDFEADLAGIDPVRAELYQTCERPDVGLTVMKPFAGGRLFDAARSPFGVALTPIQCLHYALTRPGVTSVMAGVDTPQQVLEAVAYLTASEEDKDYATVLANAPKHASSGQCTYCGHCKPCPVNIDIAMVNKLYDLAEMQPDLLQSVREHYNSLDAFASECLQCGQCEERCPFQVPVRERMVMIAEMFGK